MKSISPTMLKEYLLCQRSFQYKRIYNLALIPSTLARFQKKLQERITNFTSSFFSVLNSDCNKVSPELSRSEINYLLTSKFYSYLDAYSDQKKKFLKELDERIFTFLLWLIHFLWNNLQSQNQENANILPTMVNKLIKSSEVRLHGRPSAIFINSNNFALILAQSYDFKFLHLKGFDYIQAAIYARILNSLNYKTKYYVSVNYYDSTITYFKINSEIFDNLTHILEKFLTSIEEREFNPPNSPPCNYCEFKLICKT